MKSGDIIRNLREERGMTQEDLAKAVGYKTRSSIAKIESGGSDPSQHMLIKIAHALEVSPAALLGSPKDEPSSPLTSPEQANFSEDFSRLSPDEQRQVIDYMRYLLSKRG